MSEIKGEERDWRRYSSSDYLITVAQVHSNLFMTLKYSAQVIATKIRAPNAQDARWLLWAMYGFHSVQAGPTPL